jgi:hypothetical protein
MDNTTADDKLNSEISLDLGTFYYQPTAKFLDESSLSLQENEYNISPYTSVNRDIIKMNITGIADVCNCSSETVNYTLNEFMKKLIGVSKQSAIYNTLIIINLKIGYLKIKSKKIRFLNFFEAKKRGVRSIAADNVSEVASNADAVSCFIESIASQRPGSIRSKFSSLRPPGETQFSHHRVNSLFTSQSSRYNSPIVQRNTAISQQRDGDKESVTKIAKKLNDLKAKANRPMNVTGTPLLNERFGKRVFFGK